MLHTVLSDFQELRISEPIENGTVSALDSCLDSGMLCLVNYFNAFSMVGHFAVIIRHDEKSYYLLDSVLGDLRLKKESFASHWRNGS